jgi:hypothetical protein
MEMFVEIGLIVKLATGSYNTWKKIKARIETSSPMYSLN